MRASMSRRSWRDRCRGLGSTHLYGHTAHLKPKFESGFLHFGLNAWKQARCQLRKPGVNMHRRTNRKKLGRLMVWQWMGWKPIMASPARCMRSFSAGATKPISATSAAVLYRRSAHLKLKFESILSCFSFQALKPGGAFNTGFDTVNLHRPTVAVAGLNGRRRGGTYQKPTLAQLAGAARTKAPSARA